MTLVKDEVLDFGVGVYENNGAAISWPSRSSSSSPSAAPCKLSNQVRDGPKIRRSEGVKNRSDPAKTSSKTHDPDKVWRILGSKTHDSDKEMAKFWSQKPTFADNPLVELPGACQCATRTVNDKKINAGVEGEARNETWRGRRCTVTERGEMNELTPGAKNDIRLRYAAVLPFMLPSRGATHLSSTRYPQNIIWFMGQPGDIERLAVVIVITESRTEIAEDQLRTLD
ncbi:hypothetical protein B0H19DRAFT_1082815 [Mycena capillaripes]|nr:hypothetical protein B0H19DRAFT_1082815 [Mycena capillaripes]